MSTVKIEHILYVTFLEYCTGVYQGQVIDVVNLLNESKTKNVNLLAFISIRNFLKERRKFKSEIPEAIIFPMIPGIANWRVNTWFLYCLTFFRRVDKIIARNPFACGIALQLQKSKKNIMVCYDGRGAIGAESEEYGVFKGCKRVENSIKIIEKNAVLKSNYRIAVSNNLVSYWEKEYGYQGNKHTVIPCTVSDKFEIFLENKHKKIEEHVRNKLSFTKEDVVFVYSGSTAEWQSFYLIKCFVEKLIKKNNHYKFIFLSKRHHDIDELLERFPGNVKRFWVPHSKVINYLHAADYGFLFRENNITNFVASPTKFAEYLSCGLNILQKGNVGDFNEFIKNHGCGKVIDTNEGEMFFFERVSYRDKMRNKELALLYYSKRSSNIRDKYNKI